MTAESPQQPRQSSAGRVLTADQCERMYAAILAELKDVHSQHPIPIEERQAALCARLLP